MSAIFAVFEILGSLGVFLFGMKVMSEGVQKVAGERLRSIMGSMTKNRFYGVMTGLLVTTIVQSSSATTVMVVSFVNAQLLRLRQAIGVIMGANLGTTTTFWIISYLGLSAKFSLTSIALPSIGLGLPMLFFNRARIRDSGETLIGFGLLFLGLDLLKNNVPDVKANPDAFAFVQQLTGFGFGSIILFLIFGILLTVMVQSSSVAGAITLALASKGWIDFPTAAAIILGENIGTTITAVLASLGANTHAKRAAAAHLIFNLTGVIWILLVFNYFIGMVDSIMPGDINDASHLPEHLALFHSMFNFCNICLLINFVPQISKLVQKLLPVNQAKESEERFPYLSGKIIHTGELNIAEAQNEVARMAELTEEMFRGFIEVYDNPDKDMGDLVKKLKNLEEISDQYDIDLTDYLIRCSTDQLSVHGAVQVTAMMRIVTELEDICDWSYRLVLLAQRKYRKKRKLPSKTRQEIREYSEQVLDFIQFYRQKLKGPLSAKDMEIAKEMEANIGKSLSSLRRKAVKRIQESGEIKAEMLYIDILSHFEKIGNHAFNIFQALEHRAM